MTADRADWPLPGPEITRPKQVFQRVILFLPPLPPLSPPSLSPHISLPLFFNSGLVLSSLKACPHTPSSLLCSLNRLLARCSPTKTHTQKNYPHTDSNTPRCSETHLYVDVRCDCICRISLTSGENKDNAFLSLCKQMFCCVSRLIRNNGILPQHWLHHHFQPSLRGTAENRKYIIGYHGERERKRDGGGVEKERRHVCLPMGKEKWPLNHGCPWKRPGKSCSCHTWSLLGHLCYLPSPSQRNRNKWVLKYSYILVFLLSAVNAELTWRELVGATVSGRLLSPIQLN